MLIKKIISPGPKHTEIHTEFQNVLKKLGEKA